MTKKEIESIAQKNSVSNATIDKDWVLGHLLNAFYTNDDNKNIFIFKGGTCLKKCYFEDYRFSEDLDFTLLDKSFKIDSNFINKITKSITEYTNIRFYLNGIKTQIHNDVEQGYEIKIKFWGADHKPNLPVPPTKRWQTYIKIDISFSEMVFDKPNMRKIIHPYSDSHFLSKTIPVYSMLEIISEKLRALIQRNRPRDIYDIWYIMNSKIGLNKLDIKNLLIQKANSKGIEISGVEQFVNDEKLRKNKRAWKSSLGHHLPIAKLPDFDFVYNDLTKVVAEIIQS